MAVQPVYHWQFAEREGSLAKDTVSGIEGRFHRIAWEGHGRIGHAVRFLSRESHINLGSVVGQLGTSDFTVAFGIKILGTDGQNDLNIIGNRSVSGHGNWVSLRLESKGRVLTFEVDENSRGKHYAVAKTDRLAINNKQWHHIALVREGPTVKIYFNGALVAEGASKTGVANINSGVDVKLGHYTRHGPTGYYEDLRIYHTALSAAQVQDLVPPLNRVLRPGEIELVATDAAAVLLSQDVADLSPYSTRFQKLRIGPDTGATLYKEADFGGVSQKLYTGVPDIKFTRLEAFPRSVHIWSSIGEPFTGNWIIAAPNGRYLSRKKHTLTTSPDHAADELFTFHYNPNLDQLMLMPVTDQEISLLRVDDQSSVLLVDDSEPDKDAFSIVHPSRDRWLKLNQNNTFRWTPQREERVIFHRAAKIADNEGQVGELAAGEVALYEHRAYYGRVWILSDSDKDRAGNYTHFTDFPDLNDRISSIRLGPDTGVTLFANENFMVSEANRETDVEDFVENVPHLSKTEVWNDEISAIKIFRTVEPETIFTSFTSKLSQDYRMVDDQLEEFSSYRTTLRFEPGADEIEVSATDLTTIEVEGALHEIDEVRSVTLSPNELNFIMITSEANGLSTPGLKFRTSAMAENEFVVIFPDQEAHQQIAELEDDALWNATDAQGKLIVDRNAHTQSEVASVQNTIKRVMATTVTSTNEAPVMNTNGGSRVQASNQVVSGAALGDPWTLNFRPRPSTVPDGSAGLVMPSDAIWEEPVNQNDFVQQLVQATAADTDPPSSPVNTPSTFASLRIGGFFSDIGDAIKDGVSVTIGFVDDAVNALVDIGGQLVRFVLDTAKKVADFVTAVVEQVVKTIKQFIEFLQFLFGWKDILATQRYLVGAINAGFDYAAQLAEDAKPHVSAFVNNLQDTVEDGMNTLVETLGGDPSEVKDSGFELPEALEWFLSKLFGGSNQSDADTTPTSGATPSGDSPLEEFIRHFLEAIENIAGAGLRAFEGVSDSLLTLLKNPRKPQQASIVMIEAFRDVIIQLLEAAEDITLGLLSVVEGVIKLFQDLLNREIKIPFISDLFELLGAGKLTVLNLSTLLLAIPVTVVHKLAFNERPFRGAAPLTFSTQPEARLTALALQRVVDEEQGENEEDTPPDRALVRGLGTTALVANVVSGVFLNPVLNAIPEPKDEPQEIDPFYGTLEAITWVLDLLIWIPTIPGLVKAVSFRDAPPEEKTLWVYRTFVLGLDLALTMYGWSPKDEPINTQRMLRANEKTIITSSILAAGDMIYAANFVNTVEDKIGLNLAHQVLFALPRLVSPLRITDEPTAPFVLVVINMATAGITTLTGSFLLANDLDALQEAM